MRSCCSFYRYKKFVSTFLAFLIFCSPVMMLNRAYATVANAGGWTLGDAVVHGATTTWTAVKDVGGKVATGVASIKPTPAQVAEGLKKAGIVGLALTVTQELLDGVDFVMDPANNTIRYKPKTCADTSCLYYYSIGDGVKYTSSAQAAEVSFQKSKKGNTGILSYSFGSTVTRPYGVVDLYTGYFGGSVYSEGYIVVSRIQNPSYDDSNTKTIPITSLASQIITQAEKDDAEAKAYVSAVAQTATAEKEEDQIVPMAQLTQALDASQTLIDEDVKSPDATTTPTTDNPAVPDTGVNTGTNTASPSDTTAKDLPAFCGWAGTVCEFIDWTKTKVQEVTDAVTEFFKEPEETDNEVDVDQPEEDEPNTDLNFNGQCPAPMTLLDTQMFGQPLTWTFDFSDFCTVLSDYLRPIVIAWGAFIATLIVGGVRTND